MTSTNGKNLNTTTGRFREGTIGLSNSSASRIKHVAYS